MFHKFAVVLDVGDGEPAAEVVVGPGTAADTQPSAENEPMDVSPEPTARDDPPHPAGNSDAQNGATANRSYDDIRISIPNSCFCKTHPCKAVVFLEFFFSGMSPVLRPRPSWRTCSNPCCVVSRSLFHVSAVWSAIFALVRGTSRTRRPSTTTVLQARERCVPARLFEPHMKNPNCILSRYFNSTYEKSELHSL